MFLSASLFKISMFDLVYANSVIRCISTNGGTKLSCMSFFPYLQDAGIWYLFHRVATGDSHSLGIETKSELTPLGIFYNNRVHSNFKVL